MSLREFTNNWALISFDTLGPQLVFTQARSIPPKSIKIMKAVWLVHQTG